MFKRILYGGGAAGALAAAYLLGSVTLGSVAAQSANPAGPQSAVTSERQDSPSATAADAADSNENERDAADSDGSEQDQANGADQESQDGVDPVTAHPATTPAQARAAALARFPNATIRKVELESENGTLVYGVALVDASGNGQDVKVDAKTATVLTVEADGPDGAEGPDAA